jgi:serine protease Do
MNVYALGVVVTLGRNQGAEITSEAPNGVAALAGLHPGDVIDSVDGKPVKTPIELAAELSGKPAGTKIRLGFLIRGEWETETVISLNATP